MILRSHGDRIPVPIAGEGHAISCLEVGARRWLFAAFHPVVTLQEVSTQLRLKAGGSRLIRGEGRQYIGDVRRPGNGIEPILIRRDAVVDEIGGRALELGIEDNELAVVEARGDRCLGISRIHSVRQRELECARSTSRHDQAHDGRRGI